MKTLIRRRVRSAASDLGLHCLSMSPKWDSRLIWVHKIKAANNNGVNQTARMLICAFVVRLLHKQVFS